MEELGTFPAARRENEDIISTSPSCSTGGTHHCANAWIDSGHHVVRQLLGASRRFAHIFFVKVSSNPEVDSRPALLVSAFYAELELSVFADTGFGVWLWFCVAVAIPATVFLLCWCGPCRCCSRMISGQEWLAMVFRRRGGVRGSRGKTEQKESWRVRSRLMGEWSGRVNSFRNQTSGQGGAAGGASTTFQRCCVGSTGRQLLQGMENGLRAPRCQVESKTGGPKVWTQKIRNFRARVEALEKEEVEGV